MPVAGVLSTGGARYTRTCWWELTSHPVCLSVCKHLRRPGLRDPFLRTPAAFPQQAQMPPIIQNLRPTLSRNSEPLSLSEEVQHVTVGPQGVPEASSQGRDHTASWQHSARQVCHRLTKRLSILGGLEVLKSEFWEAGLVPKNLQVTFKEHRAPLLRAPARIPLSGHSNAKRLFPRHS